MKPQIKFPEDERIRRGKDKRQYKPTLKHLGDKLKSLEEKKKWWERFSNTIYTARIIADYERQIVKVTSEINKVTLPVKAGR